MQPSHPNLAASSDEKGRPSTVRRVLFSVVGAALIVLGLTQLDAAPLLSLLLELLGVLAIALGQVKRQPKTFRQSLRAAAMVSARMDSIADNPPPSSVDPRSKR